MKVLLFYPPPWKIAAPGEPAATGAHGPPDGYREGDLDADFYQTPWGLFSLGAQAIRAGHQVKVFNLSSFPWSRVEEVIRRVEADVYGMSCWTANRRGVVLAAKYLKQMRPKAHVIVGGPHATPLAKELMVHCKEIDTVALGEADHTFLELLDKLSRNEAPIGIAGTYYREQGKIKEGPHRASIANLDTLASPHEYFDTHIAMTSRGCPWACTFCGAETTWGRGFRAESVGYVLDALEKAVKRLPVKMVQIKDDTFTTNKKRVMDICRGIQLRNLQFFWSCDTRVDLLNEPLLKEMRLAGCQRLSLGVESGSQEILDKIDKKITVDEIIESTRMAKKYGIKVRYYMMLGNRGETVKTFYETLDFLKRAEPHEYVFSCLSIYPGTRDFYDAEKSGWLDRKVYFTETFQELKTPFDASPETARVLNEWFYQNSGLRTVFRETVADFEAILNELPNYHAAHMDLGAAYYHEGRLNEAETHIKKALDLGYPLPGLVYNHLACIAKARGDLDGMMNHFSVAAKVDPQHYVLIQNVNRARAWFKQDGAAKNLPLELTVRHDFQLLERTAQPTLPGPLPNDYAEWKAVTVPSPEAPTFAKTPDVEGSRHGLRDKRQLKVL
ncbi:MAG: radical SAM protein [Polyangiaceae bacterium]|nr:radical SAM protein [Polyangiaceae bacterium]